MFTMIFSIYSLTHLIARSTLLVPPDAGVTSLMAARVHQAPPVTSEQTYFIIIIIIIIIFIIILHHLLI